METSKETCIVCRKDMGPAYLMEGMIFVSENQAQSAFRHNLIDDQQLIIIVCDVCLTKAENVSVREQLRDVHIEDWDADYVHVDSTEGLSLRGDIEARQRARGQLRRKYDEMTVGHPEGDETL